MRARKAPSKRIKDGLQAHIAEESAIVDDEERSCNALVKAAKGVREPVRPMCATRLPGAHGDREQPVLLLEELPLAVHRHGPGQPPVLPELVRLPVQGQPGQGGMVQNRKGGPPSDDGEFLLPHVMGVIVNRTLLDC